MSDQGPTHERRERRVSFSKPGSLGVVLIERAKALSASRRWIFICCSLLVLLVGGFADAQVGRTPKPEVAAVSNAAAASERVEPVRSSVGAISSAWYCVATPARKSDPNAGTIVVLNPAAVGLSGVVSYFPTTGGKVDAPFSVAANNRVVLRPSDVVDAPYVASLVRIDGGGAAVEHSIKVGKSTSYSSCSDDTAKDWYVSDGTTVAGSSMQLAVFNPFLEDAIVDFSFVTSEGRAAPVELQGVVLPAQTLYVSNVSDILRRREWVTATITARKGRTVVEQLQVNGSPAPDGAVVTPASPTLSSDWWFPDVIVADGFADRVSIYNPSDTEATATLVLQSDDDTKVDPFDLYVPAQGRIAVNLNDEVGVPRGARYSAHLRATNGVQVAASRTTLAGPGVPPPPPTTTTTTAVPVTTTTAAPPKVPATGSTTTAAPTVTAPPTTIPVSTFPVSGLSIQPGAAAPTQRWALAHGASVDPNEEWVWILNPSDKEAVVNVVGLSNGASLPLATDVKVGAGKRLALQLGNPAVTSLPDVSVVVNASQPVLVSRELTQAGSTTFSSSLAIPLR